MKVLELFGGIGACSKALERLGIDFEIADYVEIDKYAVASFNAIHGTNFSPQDICEWDKNIDVDLIMHGSPCQDFSIAGKQAGGNQGSGTRSSLMYETIRIVEKLRPQYVIWENVKNVLSKAHKHNFDNYINRLEELGYKSYYQVLNAKDYGVPQNRERVFVVSILNNCNYDFPKKIKCANKINKLFNLSKRISSRVIYDKNGLSPTLVAGMGEGGGNVPMIIDNFDFPQKQELKIRLKDILEDNVEEKYYLTQKMKKYIISNNEKWTGNNNKSLINKDIASTINTGEGNRRCDASNYVCNELPVNFNLKTKNSNLKQGMKCDKCMQVGELDIKGFDNIKRVYSPQGCSPTLTAMQGGNTEPKIIDDTYGFDKNVRVYDDCPTIRTSRQGLKVQENFRIRKLTPKECWRLMGFDDCDFEKAEKVNSNTQLYKQAGNSIVVNVLEAIFKNLLLGGSNN